uniref:Excision repair cross-complementation group 6-like 2 n=1 Tax=Anabas testudineus TaxID=64144 RepID=A0A7N5ZWD0_ANATE
THPGCYDLHELTPWREGDCCLAPNTTDGTLREGTIQRLTSNSQNNETTAWVIFTNHSKDAEEEEEEKEEAILVTNLLRPALNDFTREKPVFPNIVTDRRLCVPLELSDHDGDRVPYTINRYLRDYQREGIRFIYNSYICSRGCILGDDMGLGKTVQVIGFLAAVLHKTGTWEDIKKNRPQFLQSQMPSIQSEAKKVFLIVAPLSVLYNWKDELDTWGHFQCVVVHGLRKEEELARIKKGRIEIALTTYETLRLCLDQFNNIHWSAVIVDEAHKIKNPNSQITQAMKELRCKIRIGLTGTILQNNLEELWCVMDWAIPGCLGSLGHFKTKFSDPIEHGQRHCATKRALAVGRKAVRDLAKKVSYWFLRRTKALIKEQLPKKDDRVVFCSLTDFQQTVYQAVLDTEDVTLLLRSSEKCDCRSGKTRRRCCYKTNSEGVEIKALYFSYLAILRKVANHVALLQSTTGTSKKQEKYVSAICQKVFQKFPDFVQRCKDEAFEALSDPMYSGKMKVLQKLLKYYLKKRDKVLLFSLSTKLLDVLESYCMAEGLDYSRLDGTTKSKERVQIVKEFNTSSHINLCLVSTMAGGLGLNFVGANVVVLFDPTWNPANDLQAIDRAYRIGQCRDVTVLRLISLGTVEEVIYLRQVYKQQLQCSVVGKETARRYFEAVQGHGVHKGELFGIKNLFRLQTQGTCLTLQILEVNKEALKIPRELLDFSSGSEEDEEMQRLQRDASNSSAVVGNRNVNAATGPGRKSLLQHGFSRLLERVEGNLELGDRDSPGVEESLSDTDAKDQGRIGKSEGTSKTANGAACPPKLETKTWDLSSGSDREHEGSGHHSLLKESTGPVSKRQGLKGWTSKKTIVDEESDEESSSDKKNKNRLKTTVSTAQGVHIYSDESEDFELERSTWSRKDALKVRCRGQDSRRGRLDSTRKRQSASVRNKARSKHTEDIETFTSSEDEHTPPKKGRSIESHVTSPQMERSRVDIPKDRQIDWTKRHKAVSFTSLKSQTSPASKGRDGTIESVLEGVQEVVYTHSNQRVVGGSKAEQFISRAAVRDVFERKMHSQLPANHLIGTQQLEEMAEKFKFPSVYQFALEIKKRNSTQRLAWLRHFPQPDSAHTSSSSAATPSTSTQTAATKTHTETRAPQMDVPKATKKPKYTLESQEPKTKQNNVPVTQKSRIPQNNVPEPQKKQKIPKKNVREPLSDFRIPVSEDEAQTVCNSPSSPDLSHGMSNTLSKPTAQGRQQEQKSSSRTRETFQEQTENSQTASAPEQAPSSSSNCSFLTDLIGDTSILDDLFKPKPKGVHSPVQASKRGRKDFWDILNEGNEESINRLTDPAEVQRVCINTNVLIRNRPTEEESKSLWRTNEKFLWKK